MWVYLDNVEMPKNCHEGPCHDYTVLTNADRIREMTDEDLAQHLFDVANYACPPGKEFTDIFCGKYPDCKKCWLNWLKHEADT